MIRIADESDAQALLDIYAPLVCNSIISFELLPPSLEEMRQRITETLDLFPWLVLESDHQILGYAYSSSHRSRLAYQWSVDVSIYIDPQAHRRGYGRKLYQTLFNILRIQGFYTALAGIALPNQGSVGLHESMGFELVGVYKNVGYKFGEWRDVGWWELRLKEYDKPPNPPLWFKDLKDRSELKELLVD